MIRFVVLGSLLGLFSGIVPGPFTALIATTAFQQGLRTGILVAVVPVLTETTVMALTAALVYRLPERALQVMGVVGGGLLAVFVGIYVGIAFAAAHGRKQMPKKWYRRIMFGAAGVLALAGAALIWQSWVGNFQRLVKGSQGIESRVNESLNEPGAQ